MCKFPEKFFVKCIKSFHTINRNGCIVNEVKEGEEFKVSFEEEIGEYFTTDSKNRSVYVGYLDRSDLVHIENNFRLLAISENKFDYVYTK